MSHIRMLAAEHAGLPVPRRRTYSDEGRAPDLDAAGEMLLHTIGIDAPRSS